jgi:hypothetical protein
LASLSCLSFAATTLIGAEAEACGGCFVPATESTVVTGHRMAMSVSKTQSVLWDQIRYAGDPSEFSWVLPVKPGARVELANDAWFDVLEAGTNTNVTEPPEGCSSPSPGCGNAFATSDSAGVADFDNGGVTVVHQGTIGPYATVTLSAEDPNALNAWLNDNGYSVPESIQPIIDAYVNEGFDFVALKLQPGKGVQTMKPVRVITPGANFTLPLRMVAAGAAAKVDLVLYMIGEGRYEAANFGNVDVPPSLVTWDFRTDSTNFADLRLAALSAGDGANWLTSYAQPRAPLTAAESDVRTFSFPDDPQNPFGSGLFLDSIAEAYYAQGKVTGEADPTTNINACFDNLRRLASQDLVVVDNCDEQGTCAPLESGQISQNDVSCGNLDDIAVALTAMSVKDVYLTRLEATLPLAALDRDLQLQAAASQAPIAGNFVAGLKVNHCWDNSEGRASAAPVAFNKQQGDDDPLSPGALLMLTFAAAGMFLVARRRSDALEIG